jgi:diphthamide synthase (EF-2-diphthine--ammonia ligase)
MEEADRVAMHAVRRELVERQAAAAGLPLWAVPLPWPCSNEQYESLMAQTCAKAVAEGIEGVAFGDLFLEDVRAYREKQMKDTRLEPIFPVWGLPTRALAQEMIASGTRAKLTCIDTKNWIGRSLDANSIKRCLRLCPRMWIRAANGGNSIRLCMPGPC